MLHNHLVLQTVPIALTNTISILIRPSSAFHLQTGVETQDFASLHNRIEFPKRPDSSFFVFSCLCGYFKIPVNKYYG